MSWEALESSCKLEDGERERREQGECIEERR